MAGSAAPATGQLTVRADSAFYSKTVLTTAAKLDVRFSITARQDKRIRAAIDAIEESAWQPIPYWLSTPEVSGADVAETSYTVFATDKRHARTVRLVVRRVRPTLVDNGRPCRSAGNRMPGCTTRTTLSVPSLSGSRFPRPMVASLAEPFGLWPAREGR